MTFSVEVVGPKIIIMSIAQPVMEGCVDPPWGQKPQCPLTLTSESWTHIH